MRIADFKQLKVDNSKLYKRVDLNFQLNNLLDTKYSLFVDELNYQMKEEINAAEIEKIDEDILFQFNTDLPRIELAPLMDLIVNTFIKHFTLSKEYKHGEKRLGIPEDLKSVNISDVNLMDLVNYPLKKERFTIEVLDNKSRVLANILIK